MSAELLAKIITIGIFLVIAFVVLYGLLKFITYVFTIKHICDIKTGKWQEKMEKLEKQDQEKQMNKLEKNRKNKTGVYW